MILYKGLQIDRSMKWDIDDLENRLNKISEDLNKQEEKVNNIDKNIHSNKIKSHYDEMNEKYKKWISQYSKEYIEMSEWYYGEELPYDVYCKEFNIVTSESTYLDSPKDVKDLYALFIFYTLFSFNIGKVFSN